MTLANRHRVRVTSSGTTARTRGEAPEADRNHGTTALAGRDRSRLTTPAEAPAVVHEFADALPAGPVANAARRVVVAVTDGSWQVEPSGGVNDG
ncbi:hypothetical protein [Herbidospora sp. NBRC 101105]|uniref:hypothetical protein n=1 Tax=Herbidospora sp. NBRC 101105 TaxID=3032195 RepID=UPI0024A58F7F|nr:hypothetical protein [Herbidospora sp. NBRC 101105]GLX94319.1 hypothetical protein Hesp01_22690 [Herbidospora sp. NBRC 101105]